MSTLDDTEIIPADESGDTPGAAPHGAARSPGPRGAAPPAERRPAPWPDS